MLIGSEVPRRRHAENDLGRYNDGIYNSRQTHSGLRYKSSITFEAKIAIKE
jgi:hypothetical protein